MRLEQDFPYLKHLRFEGTSGGILITGNSDYSEPGRFHFELNMFDKPLDSLYQLQFDLEEPTCKSDFARELRELPLNLKYSGQSCSDGDKLVVVRALHEVRVYIHLLLEKREAIVDEINENIERLKVIHERVTRKKRQDYELVTETCDEFMKDLSFFKKNLRQYNVKQNFDSKFKRNSWHF